MIPQELVLVHFTNCSVVVLFSRVQPGQVRVTPVVQALRALALFTGLLGELSNGTYCMAVSVRNYRMRLGKVITIDTVMGDIGVFNVRNLMLVYL